MVLTYVGTDWQPKGHLVNMNSRPGTTHILVLSDFKLENSSSITHLSLLFVKYHQMLIYNFNLIYVYIPGLKSQLAQEHPRPHN